VELGDGVGIVGRSHGDGNGIIEDVGALLLFAKVGRLDSSHKFQLAIPIPNTPDVEGM
jgi:hypothetical protein